MHKCECVFVVLHVHNVHCIVYVQCENMCKSFVIAHYTFRNNLYSTGSSICRLNAFRAPAQKKRGTISTKASISGPVEILI